MDNNVRKAYLTYGTIAVLVLQLLIFIQGKDSYVVIHDNLDSEFTYLQALKQEGLLLRSPKDAEVTSIMNGLPRKFFRSPYHLTSLIYYSMPPFTAYVINRLLVHIIAFIGMFLLLMRYFSKLPPSVSLICSFLFSAIGYYHIQYGISVAGQPLLLFAFLNILHGDKKVLNWVIILLFPLFSFIAVTLPFILPALVIVAVFHMNKGWSALKYYVIGLIILCVGQIISEWQIIFQIFQSGTEPSHRMEFSHPENRQFSIGFLIDYLKYTRYHTGIFKTQAIWFLLLVALISRKKMILQQWLIIISIILIGTLHLNYDWIKVDILQPMGLSIMNLSRFYFLLPVLWFLLMASIMTQFRWSSPLTKLLYAIVLIWIGVDVFKNDPEFMNNKKLIMGAEIEAPTFRQFYATDQFHEIKQLIESEVNDPKVLSLGMYPNIALYNGLSVLDSYQNNYPLTYKYEFRPIIANELAKSEELRKYFDTWGSRCYLFSAELGKNFLISKNSTKRIQNLDINIGAIREMNGTHILSALQIENAEQLGIQQIGVFEHPESFWKIWLYEI